MTPTRVNHQLVYADRRALSPLASSINVSLLSPHMFTPEGKGSFIWGQMPSGPDWTSRLGIVCNKPEGEATEVEIDVFGSGGHLTSRKYTVGSLGAVEIDVADIVNGHAPNNDDGYEYLWYTARSSRPDLSGIAVTGHTRTGHTTGEHNF